MTAEELVLLESYLSKTLNMDKAGVAALIDADGNLKPESITQLLTEDAKRVTTLTTGKFDEGHKAAEKKVKSAFEKELKAKFNVESDKQGVELVSDIVAAKTTGPALTEEAVKSHKAYLDLQESVKDQVKTAVKAKETEFDTFKTNVERSSTLNKVKEKADVLFTAMKPILSTDPVKAANQKAFFLEEIGKGNYRIDGDRIILLKADGSGDETDAHGHRIDFEAKIKETAGKYYDFAKAEDRQAPGNNNDLKKDDKGKIIAIVKDEKDFTSQFTNAKTSEERAAIKTAWDETQAGTKT